MMSRPSRHLTTLALAGVLAVIPMAGCSSSGDVSVTGGTTAPSAPAVGSHLDPAAFAAALKRPGTVLLDVRTPAEFAQGHLEGATNIDIESAGFVAQIAQIDKTKTYAVYCHSGNRSGAALQQMAQMGFAAAFDLQGGISAWESAGGKVSTG
ncbi:MAG TPA: rhodanese-like domain-containing protein, partial [Pengzhenrongella sp.]